MIDDVGQRGAVRRTAGGGAEHDGDLRHPAARRGSCAAKTCADPRRGAATPSASRAPPECQTPMTGTPLATPGRSRRRCAWQPSLPMRAAHARWRRWRRRRPRAVDGAAAPSAGRPGRRARTSLSSTRRSRTSGLTGRRRGGLGCRCGRGAPAGVSTRMSRSVTRGERPERRCDRRSRTSCSTRPGCAMWRALCAATSQA